MAGRSPVHGPRGALRRRFPPPPVAASRVGSAPNQSGGSTRRSTAGRYSAPVAFSSSALSTAAPAAPRTVLCPMATNL